MMRFKILKNKEKKLNRDKRRKISGKKNRLPSATVNLMHGNGKKKKIITKEWMPYTKINRKENLQIPLSLVVFFFLLLNIQIIQKFFQFYAQKPLHSISSLTTAQTH